ncbi:response regulator [Pelomonas sp. V22]|uniref:response regulator n=1 Tax=Pelomonas sp. V22 TaxID=2822139 RepID=UPI0024A7D0D7|nr:HD domain-containing phosphohydrolase [Pelomonas sp. V22]MDI4634915.1 response regulator [Pelomonas sp. V22]
MFKSQRPLVLIVDDNAENLTVLGELLQPLYQVRAANGGERALQLMQLDPCPDLVLLDVMMPDLDGYEVLRRLRADPATAEVPVIFVTALGATDDEERGLAHGAVDYITKPIRPQVLLARVAAHIELRRARVRLQDRNHDLEAEVSRRMQENERIRDISMHALARLAETRDNETGFHLLRTREYMRLLADELRRQRLFADELDAAAADLMVRSAPLHDIGKVGIPDRILHKEGRLDDEEWAIMKTHARLGADAIVQAERDAGSDAGMDYLRYAKQIAMSHHERWDGRGYPQGLAGEAIPLAARLMALADVFDALTCRRVYKEAWSLEAARELIVKERGQHFDPRVADAFLACYEDFCRVATQFRDEATDDRRS